MEQRSDQRMHEATKAAAVAVEDERKMNDMEARQAAIRAVAKVQALAKERITAIQRDADQR